MSFRPGPRVYGTAEIDPQAFKRVMLELDGIKDEKNQRRVLSRAGNAANQIIRDETIKKYRGAVSTLRHGGGEFGKGITDPASYKGKTVKRRGGGMDFVAWISFKYKSTRLLHLFETGFTPGGGGGVRSSKTGQFGKSGFGESSTPRKPVPGWGIRMRVVSEQAEKVNRVFLAAMRIMLETGGKKSKQISVGKLRKMAGG